MIVLTGVEGFIGSCMLRTLNDAGYSDIAICDLLDREDRRELYKDKSYSQQVNRDHLAAFISHNAGEIDAVIHLGARTDTAEKDIDLFNKLNFHYSQAIWKVCTEAQLPLIYASSAATYGDGKEGFSDHHGVVESLKPLNPYGDSKQQMDIWALAQVKQPPFWAGVKFFNVYGPNEYHKGRMASVIFHTFNQIQQTGKMKLFRSHHPDFADGGQLRDFIYVKDVCRILMHLLEKQPASGLYNAGTGQARTFLDLATAVFENLGLEPEIEYIDIPLDIRDTYQYYTQADMSKLLGTGFDQPFISLEEGVKEYVKMYLNGHNLY